MSVNMIMVCPHEGKCHVICIWSLEKAVVQAAFAERAVFKEIEIKREIVDSVCDGGFDLFFHDTRIALILVAPEGELGLIVSGKARGGVLRDAPFGPSGPVDFFTARVDVPVREIIGRDDRFLFHSVYEPLFHTLPAPPDADTASPFLLKPGAPC